MGVPRSPVRTFSLLGGLGLPARINVGQMLGWGVCGMLRLVLHGLLRKFGGDAVLCLYVAERRVVEEELIYRG